MRKAFKRINSAMAARLWKTGYLIAVVFLLLARPVANMAQAPQPNGAAVRGGVLPKSWLLGGPNCIELPEFQIHEYNEDLYILRQSGCSNFEKPFLYLLFGTDKALLLDTGAGKTEVSRYVKRVIESWLRRNKRESIPLVVAHSHAHRDHTSGDEQLTALPGVTLVKPDVKSVQEFFGITHWPDQIAQYELGGRTLDIIPIPGHEKSSIAVYDRQTGILLTGDTLYPGRLYVFDPDEYSHSIKRLVDFTKGKIVAHILGAHVENTRTPYLDYPVGTLYQPNEHELELGRAHLLELNDALQQMNGKVVRMAMRDFTIWPISQK
jgi:glyoxylase-like metal-dependent hydrolase (beta-lactamase superfamily II)